MPCKHPQRAHSFREVVIVVVVAVPCCFAGLTHKQCANKEALAGESYYWPATNPALVAPVVAVYDYPDYDTPMQARHTGNALVVEIPKASAAGFALQVPSNKSGNITGRSSDFYLLRSIELRKPAQVAEGNSQRLSHVFEAHLIHEHATQKHWASVIVPFDVQAEPTTVDILTALIGLSSLPSKNGQVAPVLLSRSQNLDLNSVWVSATFQHFWATLPSACGNFQVPARQFMRTSAIATSQAIFHSLMQALDSAVSRTPVDPPAVSWMLHACPPSACFRPGPVALSPLIARAHKSQEKSRAQLRERKALLDKDLLSLAGKAEDKALSDRNSAFKAVVFDRDMLRQTESQLEAIDRNDDRLAAWSSLATGAVWDADAPSKALAGASAIASSNASSALLSTARHVVSPGNSIKQSAILRHSRTLVTL